MNTSATLDTGRVLARNGAVTLDTNVIRRATCATPSTPPSTAGPGAPAPTAQGPTPATTPSPSAAPNATLRPGTSRLSGPSQPVRGTFTVTVTGRGIHSVVFYLDGKRLGVVRRGARPGRFSWTIDPRGQRFGTHRISAHVNYAIARNTGTSIRRLTYQRSRPTPPIAFTG